MNFRKVDESEWRCLQSTFYSHVEINERVRKLIGWLGTFFNEREVGGVSGLKFLQTDGGDVLCNIVSPFGNGRMRLNWAIFDNVLHGTLYIDRNCLDSFGQPAWETIWRLHISPNSKVFVESEHDGFNLRMGSGKQLENEVFEIGMSILYAIVNGPVIKKLV
jgi:hypothetical protein